MREKCWGMDSRVLNVEMDFDVGSHMAAAYSSMGLTRVFFKSR